jgi:hypothetical protein
MIAFEYMKGRVATEPLTICALLSSAYVMCETDGRLCKVVAGSNTDGALGWELSLSPSGAIDVGRLKLLVE